MREREREREKPGGKRANKTQIRSINDEKIGLLSQK